MKTTNSRTQVSANRSHPRRLTRIEQLEQRTLMSVGPMPYDGALGVFGHAGDGHDHEGTATQGLVGAAGADGPGMAPALAGGVAAEPLAEGLTGVQNVMVLRVYFNDYAATSRYAKMDVEGFFGELDQLWQNTSYGNISIAAQVTELYALPKNRSDYVNDYPDGDLSEEKYDTVLLDAIAAAPTDAGLDWTNLSAVFVVMAETDVSQFHRGEAIARELPMGPGGATERVGAGIFSENPSETDRQVWGRWAHELGHAFQQGGPAHPSNYNSEFELMDSNYPGQTGVFEKLPGMGFPGWMPEAKYQIFTPFGSGKPGEGGGTANIWAMEHPPGGQPNFQAVKAELSEDLYYLVSVRRRILGDDLNGDFSPAGIPDEGVLIEKVEVGGDRWVTVMAPPGRTRNELWQAGEVFDGGDVVVEVTRKIDSNGDNYQVRVRYTSEFGSQPDVAMEPWISAPGNTYETTDIWIDSPVNGYDDGSIDADAFTYGVWNDLSDNPVPRGNGDAPAIGQVNRLYARVRNLGGIAANNVVVNWQITDPAIAGVGPTSPWTTIGSVSQADFPELASIPGGGFVDVYLEWTPDFPIPQEQLENGLFQLHRCIRVTIDPVAGETVLGNQDGNDEQENIFTFQVPESSGAAGEPMSTSILLHNPAATPKFFYLDYKSNLPAAWDVEINGGDLSVRLAANEIREIPVVIKPSGSSGLGSAFRVEVTALSMRTLVNDLDPADTHVEFQSLGGVVVETRVQRRPSLTIQRADRLNDGTIRVTGKLSVQGFSSLYDPAHPFRVMVQAVDANRRFEHTMMEISAVASNGTFHAQITDPTPGSPVLEVVAMFAGTVELASASTGYVDTVATDFYYAFDAVSGHLVEIDAVGGQARHVGSTGISEWLNGLALTNAGVLYGHSANAGEFGGNNFYKIDRLSGAATLIGPIQKIVGGAMAYDPETDSIYTTTATGGFLVKINPGTGRGTTSGAGVPGLTSPTAAAYDTRNHRLIVFDNADDQFYSFDPATGNATLLSSASPVLSGMAMAYNGSNFVISDHNTKTLRLLNPDTGVSSPLLTPSEPLNLAALEFVDRFSQGGLLGIDWSAATIYDVDPTTGAVSNPRPTDLEDTVGIAFAADHTLYTLTASTASSYPNSLFKLDRVTGAATLVGPTGLGQIAEADLDFDPTTGILYGVQNILPVGQRQLFTIDASTGRATVVGSIGTADYSAMAFDVRGNLYVLNTTSNVLLRVNKSTAATISSTPLSRNLGFVAGMDFDPATGTLYVVDGGSGGTDALYTLDPDTGVLTPMGGTRLASGLGGLAFVPITGVIRGTSFNDRNGDGTRDSGEEGLPNRQVFLDENNNGAINPITTTTRSGAAGVVPDVGAIPYPLVATGLVARLTDLNVTLNVTHPFMASLYGYLVSPHGTKVDLFIPGQIGGASLVNTTFDDEATRRISGGVPGGTVSFQAEGLLSEFDGEDPSGVWQLVIHDTVRDNFLGVLSGWSITFTHGERVVTTDDKGEYVFAGLKPETYTVAEVQQAGWIQTVPWSPNSHRVSVGKGQVRAGRDFGNFQSGEIQGASFNDRNGNGTRGPSEEGLPNRQVFLDQNNNGAVDPVTTTTRHGSAGIIPDVAAIPFPLAVTDLVAPIVDLNVTLTIAHPRVEILDAYLVSPMGTRVELFSPGRFGGGAITATFDDEATKAEGMLAAFDGEDPTGAWLLMITDVLTDSSVGVVSGWSMQFTHGERVVTTNANGNYSFKGLKPGTYKVAEVPQPGWLHTYPNGNPATWEVVLGSGQSITEIDFGSTTVDTTPPVFANVPADLTIKATIPDGAIVTYVPPTASDTLDPAPVVTCNPASGTTFPLGITKVTCTATDDAGNSAEVVFAVTVQEATSQDTLGPTLDSLQLVRDAKGKKVTQIVLAFNEELNPVGAQTVTANYDLTLRKGSNLKPVKISSAAYSERTVTLTPRKPISFKKRADYDLTVKGNGTLTDAHGNPYDGDSDGNPGGDLVRSLSQGTIRSNIDALLEQRKLTRWLTLET